MQNKEIFYEAGLFKWQTRGELEDEIMQKKNCVFHNNCITHQDFILEYF